jgi:hypothetical protein
MTVQLYALSVPARRAHRPLAPTGPTRAAAAWHARLRSLDNESGPDPGCEVGLQDRVAAGQPAPSVIMPGACGPDVDRVHVPGGSHGRASTRSGLSLMGSLSSILTRKRAPSSVGWAKVPFHAEAGEGAAVVVIRQHAGVPVAMRIWFSSATVEGTSSTGWPPEAVAVRQDRRGWRRGGHPVADRPGYQPSI